MVRPGLLIVHDVGDFVVVRPGPVLLDVIAARCQRLGLVLGENRCIGVNDRVVMQFALITYG